MHLPAARIALLSFALLTACAAPPPAAPSGAPPASARAGAAAPAASAASGAASDDMTTDEVIETARESVRSTAVWLASGVDSWFGDRPFADGGKVTDGRLSVGVLTRQRESPDFNVRFNARFRLPNIERLTYLFVGRDDPRDVVTDKPGSLSRQDQLLATQNQDRSFFAGLGRTLNDAVDFRVGFRGGLKPYAQARLREMWSLGDRDSVDFRETVFWTVADRIGSTTAVSYEHAFSRTRIARWVSAATITQEVPRVAWSSIVGAYQSFGDQRQLSLEALVNGEQGSGVGASDYGVQVRWEQPVHRDWIIGGIVVGRFWPRPDPATERGGAWALGTSVKMRF